MAASPDLKASLFRAGEPFRGHWAQLSCFHFPDEGLDSSFSIGLPVSVAGRSPRQVSPLLSLWLCCSALNRGHVLCTQLGKPCYPGASLVGHGPGELDSLGVRRLVNQGIVGSSLCCLKPHDLRQVT